MLPWTTIESSRISMRQVEITEIVDYIKNNNYNLYSTLHLDIKCSIFANALENKINNAAS